MTDIEAQVRQSATRNAQLLHILAETDHALPALEQRTQFLTELELQIRLSDEKLRALELTCQDGLKAQDKFRHSQIRRFVYTATGQKEAYAHKEESGERDYVKAVQRMQRERSINHHLKEQRREASQTKWELEEAAKRHREAQRKLNELYHTIFAGPTPQYPEEDEAEKQCHVLVLRYRNARRWWEAESRAVELLTESDSLMDEALAQARDALSYSRAELLGTGGGLYEMMERNRLSKADRLVSLARHQVHKARRSSPQVQPLPSSRNGANHGQTVRTLYLDSSNSRKGDDMAFRDQVKRNIGDTQRCADSVKQELFAARARRDKLEVDLDARRAQLRDARAVLQKAREAVFEAVLRQRAEKVDVEIVPVAHARVLASGPEEEQQQPEITDGVVHV
ncbi:hypothetical protein GQ602_005327 [Ophiocordyceps camponoti-floridani]|uniref:Uncharacterized protein n=1 Tax=Ophiocordyceps camponoti-floridani TaxID=2030778 RepID=A0A8H4VD34_9HYPO|nr:hypothetical protein GQ602_005327 [Ophiocordyceps camponoti-floridani]